MSLQPAAVAVPRSAREVPEVRFDPERLRHDFPALHQEVHGKPLVYLDNAATAQKPQAVLDAIGHYFKFDNANVHRGAHQLSERATRAFEDARGKVQHFLNANHAREILFVRGTTEGINLVAQSYGRSTLKPGDEIVISHLEHHSNIVPWQILCQQTGAVLRVAPINDRGEIIFAEYEKLLGPRTKIVSVAHISNSLGTINPVKGIIDLAHRAGAVVLIDGAQAVPHMKVDVRELDCDFYAFSAHKLYGPTGIGVLYGKETLLESMPPWQGGGDMIRSVSFAGTTFNELPYKFEAGTPHIAGAVGLGAAIDYVTAVGIEAAGAHEQQLLAYATSALADIPGVRLVGMAAHKAAVLSFVVDEPPMASLDVGTRLDLEGVAVRTGHHCCQPVMDRFGIPGTVRASLALYNTTLDVDRFIAALRRTVTGATARSRVTVAAPAPTASPKHIEPEYPQAVADSPQTAADELAETFELLGEWQDRYQYLIELGEKLPPLPPEYRTEPNRVHGCMSTVYLHARQKPGTPDVVEFLADSDANLVRGLLALLQKVYSGQRAEKVAAFDVQGFFGRLGLDQHLSMGRRNGLASMVQRIRQFALELAAKPRPRRLPLETMPAIAPHTPPAPAVPEPAPEGPAQSPEQRETIREGVIAALKTCYDPEIPVNIHELGLIYGVDVDPTGAVHVRMTLTTPSCPAAGSLPPEVLAKAKSVPGVTSAKVDVVWDPPWDKSRMSEEARLQLGIFD
jgi:cysteine desulfurase / selenocysteine lyase